MATLLLRLVCVLLLPRVLGVFELSITIDGQSRPLHFSRGDDYEAVARAWLEENPKAANGACAKDASDCIVETRTTDAPDSFCADKYRDCMVAALAKELEERVAAS